MKTKDSSISQPTAEYVNGGAAGDIRDKERNESGFQENDYIVKCFGKLASFTLVERCTEMFNLTWGFILNSKKFSTLHLLAGLSNGSQFLGKRVI